MLHGPNQQLSKIRKQTAEVACKDIEIAHNRPINFYSMNKVVNDFYCRKSIYYLDV
jgi:hypothetical protein